MSERDTEFRNLNLREAKDKLVLGILMQNYSKMTADITIGVDIGMILLDRLSNEQLNISGEIKFTIASGIISTLSFIVSEKIKYKNFRLEDYIHYLENL